MRDLREGLLAFYPWQCCAGAIETNRDGIAAGPAGCTCWQPVYDQTQHGPTPETVAAVAFGRRRIETRERMCTDCAYRRGSPERTGDPRYQGTPELLEYAARRDRFYCHSNEGEGGDGVAMRRLVGWRHPAGIEIPADSGDDYQPPIVDHVPYLADGSPAPLCAGWNAVGLKFAREVLRDLAEDSGPEDGCE